MASWIEISRTPASEKDALLDQLRAQRVGLIRKVEDLGDADLTVDETDTVAHWLEVYRRRGAVSDEVIAAHDLDDAVARTDIVEASLRYVVLHLIQETARHAGHADIIRESLDGTTGV